MLHNLRGLWALVLLLSFLSACGEEGPTGPDASGLEILLVQGDGQAGGPGTTLSIPLRVKVQDVLTGRASQGARVDWVIFNGVGGILDPQSSVTDGFGLASTELTLGPGLGAYRVRASLRGSQEVSVDFRADAILIPELTSVPSSPVVSGDTIVVGGANFSAFVDRNVVTFSEIRGRVISVQPLELAVEVPPCLPKRTVEVKVRIGELSTQGLPLAVKRGSTSLSLEAGEDIDLDASLGLSCVYLPSAPGVHYLVVPHSTGTVAGGIYAYSLLGLTTDGASPSAEERGEEAAEEQAPWQIQQSRAPSATGAQDRWEEQVRSLEGEAILRAHESSPVWEPRPAPASTARAVLPSLGDKRDFKVLNQTQGFEQGFDKVTATVRLVTEHSIVYVDDAAPANGFTTGELAQLAGEFDDPIHPAVTGTFGMESDLDQNGRVIILLTPAVNRLTEPGSDGFVAGFFYGLDLLVGQEGSNEGEIFYALVPDPDGLVGPPRSRSLVLNTVPAVLGHEFEHMVHFNQRILIGGASSQDALWLSEALAQMAEDLVGAAFETLGDPERAYQYWAGNWSRARRFLMEPSQVSVLASVSPGTLAERGAGWLLLKQLSSQPELEGLLGMLVRSTRTGVDNLTVQAGRNWRDVMRDWVGSLYLDGTTVPVRAGLRVPGVDLREILSDFDGSYPLKPDSLGGASFYRSGSLWSSAPDYFIITPPPSGGLALSATGQEGRPPELAMGLQVLVVRLK